MKKIKSVSGLDKSSFWHIELVQVVICRRQPAIWNVVHNAVKYSNVNNILESNSIFSVCILTLARSLGKSVYMVYSTVLQGFQKSKDISQFFIISAFLNYLSTYSIISIVGYLWWFVASCSHSCGLASGLDEEELPCRQRQRTVLWNLSSVQPHCLSHFPMHSYSQLPWGHQALA